MLDWKVVEEEAEQVGPLATPPARRPALWLATLLLLLALAIVTLQLRTRQQERALRADLMEVINAETRALAVGGAGQSQQFMDPAAPHSWQAQYRLYLEVPHKLPGLPTLRSLSWHAQGQALVELEWPPVQAGEAAYLERRAYRLSGGRWVRTALHSEPVTAAEWVGEQITLRALPEDMAVLQALELERLYTQLRTRWPEGWFMEKRILLIIEAKDPFWPDVSQKELWVQGALNSTGGSFHARPYEMAYREQVVDRLLSVAVRVPFSGKTEATARWSAHDVEQYIRLLLEAERRLWLLDAAGQATWRAERRQALQGEWLSPFSGSILSGIEPGAAERQLALELLIDMLIEEQGPQIVSQLAHAVAESKGSLHDPADYITLVVGPGAEARAQRFALMR